MIRVAGDIPFLYDDITGEVVGYIDPLNKERQLGGAGFAPGQSSARPMLPMTLSQAAVPVILAPNGTVATNGTITLGTALPTIYANAWVRLPAGAVVGGLAGLYYATFSSTTVGVITTTFVDAASAFTPYIPASTVVAVGSNSAYTQTTAADITLCNVTVPGGLMGANGAFRARVAYSAINNANQKLINTKLAASLLAGGFGITSGAVSNTDVKAANRGSQSAQLSSIASTAGVTAYGAYSTVNTAIDQPLTFTGQIATATDFIVLEGYSVEVLPA